MVAAIATMAVAAVKEVEEDERRRMRTIWGLTISPPLSPDVLVRLRLTSTRRCETHLASPSSRPWLSRDSSHTSGWFPHDHIAREPPFLFYLILVRAPGLVAVGLASVEIPQPTRSSAAYQIGFSAGPC
uniref:Uncharacterized protein n=1 Tax=Ananas comosus var. bracteatus TaxID=296719 RepID=A0A6V7NTC3_ANACO|nr:unnamed protein product [Ananas comosus var. bracteatus]